MTPASPPPVPSLVELADWYYSVLDLGEEEDEDQPLDYWSSDAGVREVLVRAFASSDCGNFAVVLHQMTGYPLVNLMGPEGYPIHTFVRTPEGHALDVTGIHPIAQLARRYGWRGKAPPTVDVSPSGACGMTLGEDWTDDGFDEQACRVAAAVRQLPWAPFDTPAFQAMTQTSLVGIDVPSPEAPDDLDEPAASAPRPKMG